jgi:hypothetical protein
MKRSSKSKTISISKRECETLLRDQLAYRLLLDAINETRAEDNLIRVLRETNIKLS